MVLEMKYSGLSLRAATLITLYANIMVNIFTLFKAMIFQQNSAYKRIMGDGVSFGVDVILSCVEIGVYFAAIEALRNRKILPLYLTLILEFLNMNIAGCLMYKLFLAESAAAAVNQGGSSELNQFFGYFDVEWECFFTAGKLVMCSVWAVCLTSHLFSAATEHKSREKLKESLNDKGPVSHHRRASSDPPPCYTISPIELVSPPSYSVFI